MTDEAYVYKLKMKFTIAQTATMMGFWWNSFSDYEVSERLIKCSYTKI